jgi:uncharacterized protein
MRRLSLHTLAFGEASEIERRVSVDAAAFTFGGLEYDVDDGSVDLLIAASRVGSRLTLKGRGRAKVSGPCQRCLGDAALDVDFTAEDYVNDGESEGGEDDHYTSGGVLDVERWVRDALAEGLPERILCRDDCRGLCPQCGADLNEVGPGHEHR